VTFAVENVYLPGIGWEEFGYEVKHFDLFGLEDRCEFCLDTGHLKLSTLTLEQILALPFELTCLHLHSNDGRSDQHLPLTRANFEHWEQVEALLAPERYMVLEVKNGLEGLPHIVEGLRENRIAA
jgi:sugar phosphate isomerase/epimerase